MLAFVSTLCAQSRGCRTHVRYFARIVPLRVQRRQRDFSFSPRIQGLTHRQVLGCTQQRQGGRGSHLLYAYPQVPAQEPRHRLAPVEEAVGKVSKRDDRVG